MLFVAAAPAGAQPVSSLDFQIADGYISPGDEVRLFGGCYAEEFTSTPVISGILEAPDLTGEPMSGGGWFVTSDATVKPDTAPGTYPVSYLCGETTISRDMVIHEANPEREIGLAEEKVVPGQDVTIRAVCTDPSFTRSWTHSSVLEIVDPWITREDGANPADPMTLKARVKPDTAPGTYEIFFDCVGYTDGEFTVQAAASSPTTRPIPVAQQVPVKPKGAADTGSLDAAPSPEPNSSAITVALGGLAVFAGGGTLLAYRRRHKA